MSSATENDYGVVTGKGTIRFKRVLPGPIERVWEYLTDSEKRGRWLATGDWASKAGGKAELHFRHADLTPHDDPIPEKYKAMEEGVSFTGRVVRCEPPHRVTVTWPEESGEDSELTFELTERDDGSVLLVLTHSRLSDEGIQSVGPGWHAHLRILQDRLDGREPGPFWPNILRYEAEYAERLSKR